MKKMLFVLALTFLTSRTFAFEATVKGFLALDMLLDKKIERQNASLNSGIGVLDLKVLAEHENLSAKFKLDLDDSDIGQAYNIFEEATASYKFYDRKFKITAGKGVVPFHFLHWGAMENSYLDGGTILGVHPYWTDVDNRLILSLNYNDKDRNFADSITFWGNSYQYKKDKTTGKFYPTPKDNTDFSLEVENSKTFDTKDEWGLANKFWMYPTKGLELTFGSIIYKHKLLPRENWAFDVGAGYEEENSFEFWMEVMYGKGSTAQYAKYASYKKIDRTFQLGAEIYGTELINCVANLEYAILDNDYWETDSKYTNINKGKIQTELTRTSKIDLAIKFKIAKSAHIAVGVMGERQEKKLTFLPSSGKVDAEIVTHASEIGTKLSFWF